MPKAKTERTAARKKPTAKKVPTGVAQKAAEAAEAGLDLSVKGRKQNEATLADLPIGAITVMEGFNPRASLGSREDMDLLTTNIDKDGLIHPLVVRPTKDTGRYELVCGHRRFAALKRLKRDTVACTIRADLQGDGAKALALAVAENSEDISHPLNHIEIGRAAQELQKKHKWSPQRIADHTGVNVAKIRRALTLVDAPDDVQKQVVSGDLSMLAAVEFAKMDAKTRDKIRPQIQRNMSAVEVKRLGKRASQEGGAKPAAGKAANKQRGAKRDAAIITWVGARQKQRQIVQFADTLDGATAKQKTLPEYSEIRGGLGVLLWCRGDLDSPVLPSEQKSEQEAGDAKVLRKFQALVRAEAKKFVPEEGEEGEGGEE